MDPITLSILMGTGQAILPAIKSIQQGSRLKNLPDIERPDFQIPQAAKEKLNLARTIASNRNMPGYDEALDKIENQTNRAIGDVKAAGGNMQDIMAAMASANVGAAMAKRDLDITNAKSYLGSLQNLQGQLGDYASYENMKQQDQMKAYNDEMARRAALDTARQQNMQNAVGSVAQGAASGLGYQMNANLMDKQFQNNLALQNAGFDLGLRNATAATTPSATLPNATTNNPTPSATIPAATATQTATVPAVTTAQGTMAFPDFSQVVTRDQFINADITSNPELFSGVLNSMWNNQDRLGISNDDSVSAKLGKYYDWIIANQGAITPQMSAYPIMEGVYNMYKK